MLRNNIIVLHTLTYTSACSWLQSGGKHRIWYPIRVAAHKDSLLAASGGNTGIELPVANVFSLGSLAQLAEQRIRNAQVGSSSLPSSSTVRLGDALFENPPKKLSAGACTC